MRHRWVRWRGGGRSIYVFSGLQWRLAIGRRWLRALVETHDVALCRRSLNWTLPVRRLHYLIKTFFIFWQTIPIFTIPTFFDEYLLFSKITYHSSFSLHLIQISVVSSIFHYFIMNSSHFYKKNCLDQSILFSKHSSDPSFFFIYQHNFHHLIDNFYFFYKFFTVLLMRNYSNKIRFFKKSWTIYNLFIVYLIILSTFFIFTNSLHFCENMISRPKFTFFLKCLISYHCFQILSFFLLCH